MPPAIPDKIPCESTHQLEQELAALREALSYQETEETWERIARALTRFSAVVKGGGYKFEKELIHGVKLSAKPIISAMNSERTRLSAASLDCVTVIAPRIGTAFEALVPLFMPHIIRLSTRPNKVYVTRSQASLNLILGYCHIASIVPHLLTACKESKIVTGRAVAVEGILRCLNKWDWAQRDIKARVGDVEGVIKVTGRDKDAGIRQTSRKVFEAYKTLFPERVDEFTAPLTPVMRKYLDIKSLSHIGNPVERTRLLSAHEKPKRPPVRSDLAASTSSVPSETSTNARAALGAHARSASSNAVVAGSSACPEECHPGDAEAIVRSMPPPPNIPSHARNNSSRSRTQSRQEHHQEEQQAPYERERVISACSTYSTKSAPSSSHLAHTHRPPQRLVSSQSHFAGPNPVVAVSSGQARRVRNVVAVEPHPANRPDVVAVEPHPANRPDVVHKAPFRPTPIPGVNAPRVTKPHKGPAREPVNVAKGTAGVAFPTSEPAHMERKGAQRVPKTAPAPPRIATPTSPKMERPATATGVIPKREAKPSIFRRAPEKIKDGEKKEGFAPRRGGGVTQPTLSQLSKQRAPVGPPAASSRLAKATITRGVPTSRGRGRGGLIRAPTSRLGLSGVTQVRPAMVPLPASPGREREIVPQLVPLPESPKVTPVKRDQEESLEQPLEEEQKEKPSSEGEQETILPGSGPEVMSPDGEQEMPLLDNEPKEEASPDVKGSAEAHLVAEEVPEIIDMPAGGEQDTNHAEDVVEGVQSPLDISPVKVGQEDVFVVQTAPAVPHTPPFPSADSDSEEDELEAIEFTTRDAYGPDGVPIKTPRKVVAERNPLGDVVLNG